MIHNLTGGQYLKRQEVERSSFLAGLMWIEHEIDKNQVEEAEIKKKHGTRG
jgi:hypothetical protein